MGSTNFAGALVDRSQGKIDVALSQFARGYRNNELVGERLFPRVPVLKQSDKYWRWGREGQQLTENDLRARGAAAERIVQTISTDNYLAQDHSLARVIDEQERESFEAGDVEQWATQTLTDKILLALEDRIAVLATTAGTYPAGNKVQLAADGAAATNQWSGLGGQPVKNVMTGHLKLMETGGKGSVLIIGPAVLQELKSNPVITARISALTGGRKDARNVTVSTEDLASIFEVEEVVVASAVKLTAAGVASFVWGKHAILARVNPGATPFDPSFGKLFLWTSAPGTVAGFETLIGPFGPPSAKSDELSVHMYYDIKVTSDISGYFIQDAVA